MTIEKLDNCRSALDEIRSIRERITRLRSDRERMTQVITGMPGAGRGASQNRLEDITEKLLELEEELAGRVIKREGEVAEVEDWIETLKPYQKIVARLRYVEGLTKRQVAKKAGYTFDGVKTINRALRKKCTPLHPPKSDIV